jgi:HEAT repeat protein
MFRPLLAAVFTISLAAPAAADEVADLIKKLRAAELVSRYQVESELGQKLKPPHVPVVLKEIEAGPAEFRPHFIRAIRWMGGPEAISALKGLLAKYEVKTRVETAYALKILGDDEGMKSLVVEAQKATHSKEDRIWILQYLQAGFYSGKEVPPVLRKIVETDKEPEVRKRALQSLTSHKDAESGPWLKKLANDEKDPLHVEALAELIKLGDPDAVEKGLAILEKGKLDVNPMFDLLFALRTAGGRDVAERLRALLDRTDNVSARMQIISTLAQLKDTKSIPMLVKLVEDKNPSVADAAVMALVELAGRGQIETIRKLLKHASADRRLKGAEALVALDDPSGIPVLKETLNEKTVYYRQRAVTALSGCRSKEVVEPLLFAMSDEDVNVRSSAGTGLMAVLAALYPYRKFDLAKAGYDARNGTAQARADAIAKIREWWEKNR